MLLPYSKTFTGLKPRPQVREQITDRLVQLWRQYNPPLSPSPVSPLGAPSTSYIRIPRLKLCVSSHLWSPSFYLRCSSSSSRVSSPSLICLQHRGFRLNLQVLTLLRPLTLCIKAFCCFHLTRPHSCALCHRSRFPFTCT